FRRKTTPSAEVPSLAKTLSPGGAGETPPNAPAIAQALRAWPAATLRLAPYAGSGAAGHAPATWPAGASAFGATRERRPATSPGHADCRVGVRRHLHARNADSGE